MLNTNPAGAEGAGEERWVGGGGQRKLRSTWGPAALFCPWLGESRTWIRSAGVPARLCREAGERIGLLAFPCPSGFPGVPLTPVRKASPVLQEHCNLFQGAIGGLSGRLEEFKVFGEPAKDFLQLFSCLAGPETPLVSTAKHCCPCVLDGMRQNWGIPQLHMLAMCAGGSGLQPLQTF